MVDYFMALAGALAFCVCLSSYHHPFRDACVPALRVCSFSEDTPLREREREQEKKFRFLIPLSATI